MERPSVDGGCGAVYPHGALHAPVRAPDGELEDGSEGKRGRCSSSTMAFPLAPCRDLCDIVASPMGWGREGEPCTTIPSIFSIGYVQDNGKNTPLSPFFFFFLFFTSIHFAKKEGIFFETKEMIEIYMYVRIVLSYISFRIGFKEICWFVASKKRKRLYTPSGYDIPDIRLTVDGIH